MPPDVPQVVRTTAPAKTAKRGKTTITCRVPTVYFTVSVTIKTPNTAANGAARCQSLLLIKRYKGTAEIMHRVITGIGSFTANATRKKYHHLPLFALPQKIGLGRILIKYPRLSHAGEKLGCGFKWIRCNKMTRRKSERAPENVGMMA